MIKSISFSNENRLRGESHKKKGSAFSKIRIEDINDSQYDGDDDTIEKLTNLVNSYGEQLDIKEKQISQLNKVIVSY